MSRSDERLRRGDERLDGEMFVARVLLRQVAHVRVKVSRRSWSEVEMDEARSEQRGGDCVPRQRCPMRRMGASSRAVVCDSMPKPAPGGVVNGSCTFRCRWSRLGR
jgi:hypothetical protein